MNTTIVFIDSRVQAYQALIASDGDNVIYQLLDPTQDGIEQMRTALAGINGLSSIQILSHGGVGELYLGATVLSQDNLSHYSSALATIGNSLKPGGDILLFGCDVAAGASGQGFIANLAQLTGADVAASTDTTGFGGNWQLEAQTGAIEAVSAISQSAENAYAYSLDVINGTSGDDSLNSTGNNDSIDGLAGTDTVNYTGAVDGYRLSVANGVWTIADNLGTDSLSNIEQLHFAVDGATLSLNAVGRGEFLVNTSTSNEQYTPSITGLNDGGYVVTWQSYTQDGDGWGIYGQRYSANGAAVGTEFRINTYFTGDQILPNVTGLQGGGFVVTWQTNATQDGSGSAVYGQRYDSSGVAVGSEFRINTTTADQQATGMVTALNDGGFVVTWNSYNQDASSTWGIYGQRYNASGVAVNAEFRINTTTSGSQSSSSVVALNGGGFIVTWESNGNAEDTSGYGVFGQLFDSNGAAANGEFRINSYLGNDQYGCSVGALSDGGFVVTWQSNGQDDSGWGIYGQRYDATGHAVDAEFLVNSVGWPNQSNCQVAGLTGGGFVVVWQDDARDGNSNGVFSQLYDTSGHKVGGETLISTYTVNQQTDPTVTALADGGYVIAWDSLGQDGSGWGIYAQRYHADGSPWLGQVTGTAGADTLNFNGSTTALELIGGAGDDTYILSSSGDQVTEQPGGGTDSVQAGFSYALGANLENLTLTGSGNYTATGNALNNILIGNSGNNTVSYATATAGVTVSLANTSQQNTGGAGSDTLSGFENLTGSAYHDTLSGDSGNNILDGGAGTDTVNLSGNSDDYILSLANGIWTITDNNGADGSDGTDTLRNVEQLHFAGNATDLTLNTVGRGEFLVNTYTSSDQQEPSVASLPNGGYLMVWYSNGEDTHCNGIFGQRYDASGAKDGSEFQVNTWITGEQVTPSVAVLSGSNAGGYIVTWRSDGQDGSGHGIYGQRFLANGNRDGSEFRINTTTSDDQNGPVVTGLNGSNAGGFVVTWHSNNQDGSGWGVYGQRYDTSGDKVNGEFLINTTTSGEQSTQTVTALSDGGFLVSWQSAGQDGSGYGIYGQRYNAAGAGVGGEFLINTYSSYDQGTPSVTSLLDGGVVVTWYSNVQDGSSYGIYGQRYDNTGNAAGSEFLINSYVSNDQGTPNATALTDGGFVVIWYSNGQDGSSYGVYGQRYGADGQPAGSEFQVNTYTNSTQYQPSVAALADGGFIVTWQSYGQDGSVYGIYAQRYHADGTPWLGQVTGTTGDDTLNVNGSTTPLELIGGDGNDTYMLGSGSDQVTEGSGAGSGTDTIQSSFSYVLPSNVENLTLTGSGNIDATGNSMDNKISGNAGNNRLDGGTGLDTLSYANASAAVTVDLANSDAQDTVGAGSDTLSGFENLTGSAYNDTLTGNSGNNIIDGGTGADSLSGAAGDDTYLLDNVGDTVVENSDQGSDTVLASVSYSLSANVENLTLTGSNNINATGNTLANVITGNSGDNVLLGGGGDDVFVFSASGNGVDTISDLSNFDLIRIQGANFSEIAVGDGLSVGLNQVQLGQDINGAILYIGTDANPGADVTIHLTGSFSATQLTATGSDIAVLNHGPEITSASPALSYTDTAANNSFSVQNFTATASDQNGDALVWRIRDGGNAVTSLAGAYGTLTVSGSSYSYTPNNAAINGLKTTATDSFVIQVSDGREVATQSINVTLNGVNDTPVLVVPATGQIAADNHAFNYVLPIGSFTDRDAGEFLTYTATLKNGDPLPAWMTFDGPNMTFSGTPGSTDAGSFDIRVTATDGSAAKVWTDFSLRVYGDTNEYSLIFGDKGNDILYGTLGNDQINGGLGADTMSGGLGQDTYVVDNSGDVVLEYAAEGVDIVQSLVNYTLPNFVENLTLLGKAVSGTGNALGNILIGTAKANVLTGLAGNDVLDGGAGADRLVGGEGNDSYYVDNVKDIVVELASQGSDKIFSTVSYIFSAGNNVESLTLLGGAAINATGNADANILTGNFGVNILNGLGGVDSIDGGNGADIYLIDKVGDHAQAEFADTGTSGIDEVRFTATLKTALTAPELKLVLFAGDTGIEKVVMGTGIKPVAVVTDKAALEVDASAVLNGLTLLGNAGNNKMTGTVFADTLDGGAGNDQLVGGLGNDTLWGRANADKFVFNSLLNASSNVDTIMDFNQGEADLVALDSTIFSAFSGASVSATEIRSGAGVTSAATAEQHLIYDSSTGNLYYDVDGSGTDAAAVVFATINLTGVNTSHPASMIAANFLVI